MADLTEDDLAGMSPEELRALQQQQCIFCHIVSGKVPARKVFEDEKCVAILDINPGAPGHLLLLPKEHHVIVPQLTEELLAHVGMVVKHLSMAVIRALKAQGTTVLVANGPAAGQRAPHVIFHVIPRMENDGVGLVLPERNLSDEQLHALQDALVPSVRKAFGLPDDALKFPRPSQHKPAVSQSASEHPVPKTQDAQPTTKNPQPQPPAPQPPVPPGDKTPSLDDIAKLLAGKRS